MVTWPFFWDLLCYIKVMGKLMVFLVFLASVALMVFAAYESMQGQSGWGYFLAAGIFVLIISAALASGDPNKK